MATANDTPRVHLFGLELNVSDQKPFELRDTASHLIAAVERALYQETTEGVTLEDAERYALLGLLNAARNMIGAAEKIEGAQRKPIAA